MFLVRFSKRSSPHSHREGLQSRSDYLFTPRPRITKLPLSSVPSRDRSSYLLDRKRSPNTRRISQWRHNRSQWRCLRGEMHWLVQQVLFSRMPWSIRSICTSLAIIISGFRSKTLVLVRVKTRLQVQIKRRPTDQDPLMTNEVHYTSTLDAISKIVQDEGVIGLYNGIYGSLIGVGSTNFAYFYWYSVVRTLYLSSQKLPKPPSTAVELSLGALAGAIAQIFTIPVAVVTTRQQTQPKGEQKGLIDTGREVVNSDDGWTGLWRGLKASLVLVVNPAITYGAYQRLRTVLFPGKVNLRPWEAFRMSNSAQQKFRGRAQLIERRPQCLVPCLNLSPR